ncbi:MAG: aldolase [Bradyrhizobium sp.]|nr:aldolase [Bradyrhizobium sp.]
MSLKRAIDFRTRFRRREVLIGTFVKTPSPHIVELLGDVGLDFIVIDAEHAAFDRGAIDLALLAAKAAGITTLVRAADGRPATLLGALDDGAAGVIAPHVDSAGQAAEMAASCRYTGTRGYSNAPRAGSFGADTMWRHVDDADAAATVIAMIESREAADDIAGILAVDDVDGILVGRADLTVSLRDRSPDARVAAAITERVIEAAVAAGKPVCIFAANVAETEAFIRQGVTTFIVSSDQTMLRSAARDRVDQFRRLAGARP